MRAWRQDSGQALALSAVAVGLVLLVLSLGVTGVCLLLSARAALGKAADAAALAALQQLDATLEFRVSYDTYTCDDFGACGSVPGARDVSATDGAAFQSAQSTGFGPLPGWAAAAGCIGTKWPDTPHRAGTFAICTEQHAVGADLTGPGPRALRQVADEWLAANVRADGQLSKAHVTAAEVGAGGQVTVAASADVRPPLLLFRSVHVVETAWPGTLG